MSIYYTHRVKEDNDVPYRQPVLRMSDLKLFLEAQYEMGKEAVSVKKALRLAKYEERDDFFSITFDDGHRDIIDNVLPLLEEYGVPLAVFVTSGYVTREYVPIEYFEAKVCSENRSWRSNLIHKIAKSTPPYIRWLLGSYSDYEPSTIDCSELRYLCQHPLVTIGAHGVSHVNLRYMPHTTVKSEVTKSKKFLDQKLNVDVDIFSYPYGGYRSSFGRILEDAGFQYALTTNISVLGTPFRWSVPRTSLECKINSIRK